MAAEAGLNVIRSELQSRKQPDLNWYFETAATPEENREKVLEALAEASEHVKAALRLGNKAMRLLLWLRNTRRRTSPKTAGRNIGPGTLLPVRGQGAPGKFVKFS